MLALTALHISREPASRWGTLEGRMVPIEDCKESIPPPQDSFPDRWKLNDVDRSYATPSADTAKLLEQSRIRSREMLHLSRLYLDRAIEGHRRALAILTRENIENIYITSLLVSFNTLFTLSEGDDFATVGSPSPLVPLQWLRSSQGTRQICEQWEALVGKSWMASSGVFHGRPDMLDAQDLFSPEHGRPFHRVLTWAHEYEASAPEDRDAYQKWLSYTGLIYKGIREDSDDAQTTSRRFISMPSRCPPRFIDLVEARQPRALVLLAHVFACMKLVAPRLPWYRGIAERQVPKLFELVPVGWRQMMVWPAAVAAGEVDREPIETQIFGTLVA